MTEEEFFQEVDTLKIVERHIQKVLKLEEQQSRALFARYKEVRQELRDRLDRYPEDSFSAQQLRGILVQVDAALEAMSIGLMQGMRRAAEPMAIQGVQDQLTEIEAFSKHFKGAVMPINLNVQAVALDAQNFLINRYEASIDAYSEDLRANLVTQLTNESLMGSSLSKVVKGLGAFFQGEEWKLERIARTELHNVYNVAKLNGMGESAEVLPDLMKALVHPMDKRTALDSKYANSLNLIAPLDEPFRYRWKGDVREFMAPPDRPNDRSIMIPYRQAWAG